MSKFHLYCCCVVCRKELTAQNLDEHHNKHSKPAVTKKCPVCQGDHTKPGTFCSQSCAAKHSNATRKPCRSGPKKGTVIKYKRVCRVKQCTVCGRYHPGQGSSCSKKCKSIILSSVIKTRIANGWNPQAHRGRHKRSYLETSFENWVNQNFPNVEYVSEQPFRREEQNKTYFADFFFPKINLIIELDGTQHTDSVKYDEDRDHFIADNYGVRVLRITHSEYKRKTKLDTVMSLLSESN